MGYSPPRNPIRERYNSTPTAREKAFHIWLMETYPCGCGCGLYSNEVHHPLARHPEQRWRRDHEFVVPMFWQHHRALHAAGSEAKFQPGSDYPGMAFAFREIGYARGVL